MTFVIGVDGGGTKTRAVLVDVDGAELGRGEAPGAVATAHDPEAAAGAVTGAIEAAIAAAEVTLPAAVLWAGLAGAGSEPARRAVTTALTMAGSAREIAVGTDVEAAFNDAFDGPGTMLIAGTGSVAWSRNEEGVVRSVGGWGQHLGDEGSGFAIGRAGLALVARAADGRASPTELKDHVFAHCGVTTMDDLIAWAGRARKSDFASIAPLVLRLADDGDIGAEKVAEEAAEALERHLLALDLPRGSEVALWGGLIADRGPLGGRLRARLDAYGWVILERAIDPPLGAARLALGIFRG